MQTPRALLFIAAPGLALVVGCSSSHGSTEPATDASTPPRDAADHAHPDASDAHSAPPLRDASDAQSRAPVDVPITLSSPSEEGSVRFSIPITLGAGNQVEAFLDTGSSGLRILPGVLPDSAFASISDTQITSSYHSGLLLTGVVATIAVSIGGVSTPSPIPVMLVRSVSCEPGQSNCGAEGVDAGGYVFSTADRILIGVGLRNGPSSGGVASPISQLSGSPDFVIQGAVHGGAAATLRFWPNKVEFPALKTFTLPVESDGKALPNGVPAYDDRYGLPACLDDTTSGVDYCLTAELDTGNPPVYIEWPGADDAGDTVLPSGSAIDVTIGPDGGLLTSYAFTVGSPPTEGVDEVVVEPATLPPYMNLGTQIFFRYDVYYDPSHGVIGLSPR